jgi:hypothetical protein
VERLINSLVNTLDLGDQFPPTIDIPKIDVGFDGFGPFRRLSGLRRTDRVGQTSPMHALLTTRKVEGAQTDGSQLVFGLSQDYQVDPDEDFRLGLDRGNVWIWGATITYTLRRSMFSFDVELLRVKSADFAKAKGIGLEGWAEYCWVTKEEYEKISPPGTTPAQACDL